MVIFEITPASSGKDRTNQKKKQKQQNVQAFQHKLQFVIQQIRNTKKKHAKKKIHKIKNDAKTKASQKYSSKGDENFNDGQISKIDKIIITYAKVSSLVGWIAIKIDKKKRYETLLKSLYNKKVNKK